MLLNELPAELVWRICDWLDQADVVRWSSTCSVLYQTLKCQWYHAPRLSPLISKEGYREFYDSLFTGPNWVRHVVHMEDIGLFCRVSPDPEPIDNEWGKRDSAVDIYRPQRYSTHDLMNGIMLNGVRLVSIRLSFYSDYLSGLAWSCVPRLRILILDCILPSDCLLTTIFSCQWDCLKVLKVFGCRLFSDELIGKICQQANGLEWIHFECKGSLSSSRSRPIPTNIIGQDGIEALSSLRNLRSFYNSLGGGTSIDGWTRLTNAQPNLTFLGIVLNEEEKVTMERLPDLISQLTLLSKLTIYGSVSRSSRTDYVICIEELQAIIKSRPSLKGIQVSRVDFRHIIEEFGGIPSHVGFNTPHRWSVQQALVQLGLVTSTRIHWIE